MFIDFDAIFKNKSQTTSKIPEQVLRYLSKELPKGTQYKADDQGNCYVSTNEESFSIGGFEFKPSDEEKKILGNNYTVDDLMAYSYNAQQPLEIYLKEEGTILLNGEEFPAEKMVYNLYKSLKCIEEKYFLLPPPFPDAFQLEVASNEYKKQLTFKRIPNKSIHISKYESLQNEALRFSYQMNDVDTTIKFQISYDLKCAKSIQDIVETFSIYNAFCKGEGIFCGSKISERYDVSNVNMIESKIIDFWEKVLRIETILNQKFIPPEGEVEYSTVLTIERLYQNLVLKNPIRSNERIDSVNGIWSEQSDEKIKDSINQVLCFEYQAEGSTQLFGRDIKLPCLCIVYNSKIKKYDVDTEKKEYVLYFDDMDEENKMYVSIMWFANDNELEIFVKENTTRMKDFENAKSIREYLKK